MTSERWLVIGAGALGQLFAAHLAARHHLVLLDRKGARTSVTWQSVAGERRTFELPRHTTGRDMRDATPDIVLIATKAHDAESALRRISACLAPATPLLLIQNGFSAQPLLRDRWTGPVLCASTTEAAYRPRPEAARRPAETDAASIPPSGTDVDIIHAAYGHTWIGDLDARHGALATRVAAALSAAGLEATACADIRQRLWHKLAINAVVNPLTARDRVTNGALATPAYRAEIARLVDEIATVMAAESVVTPDRGWQASLDSVIAATPTNRSSMLQDVEAGRRTERDAILGPLLASVGRHRLEVPALEALFAQTPA